jgi:hypothetical protein
MGGKRWKHFRVWGEDEGVKLGVSRYRRLYERLRDGSLVLILTE